MAFSYTGLAYLLGFFAMSLLSYRFFQYWQEEKTTVSKLFFYLNGIFTLFILITAIGGLFFARNTQILRWVVILATFTTSFGQAIASYLFIHLKFPKFSPWVGFLSVSLLGLMATVLTIITRFNPYLEADGGINWDIPPLTNTFRSILFSITFLPLIIVLFQQFKTSRDPLVKTKTFGISLVFVFGILIGFFDFFLENILKLGAISSDIAMGTLSIIVFILVFFTQKPPTSEKIEKELTHQPSSKIPW